jgi:hypothetical protein
MVKLARLLRQAQSAPVRGGRFHSAEVCEGDANATRDAFSLSPGPLRTGGLEGGPERSCSRRRQQLLWFIEAASATSDPLIEDQQDEDPRPLDCCPS